MYWLPAWRAAEGTKTTTPAVAAYAVRLCTYRLPMSLGLQSDMSSVAFWAIRRPWHGTPWSAPWASGTPPSHFRTRTHPDHLRPRLTEAAADRPEPLARHAFFDSVYSRVRNHWASTCHIPDECWVLKLLMAKMRCVGNITGKYRRISRQLVTNPATRHKQADVRKVSLHTVF